MLDTNSIRLNPGSITLDCDTQTTSFPVLKQGISANYTGMYMLTEDAYEEYMRLKKQCAIGIEKIIFNPPATIVFWSDGTKTVVKSKPDTEFNPYHGLCAAATKKLLGNGSNHKIKKIISRCSNIDYDQWEREHKQHKRNEVVRMFTNEMIRNMDILLGDRR